MWPADLPWGSSKSIKTLTGKAYTTQLHATVSLGFRMKVLKCPLWWTKENMMQGPLGCSSRRENAVQCQIEVSLYARKVFGLDVPINGLLVIGFGTEFPFIVRWQPWIAVVMIGVKEEVRCQQNKQRWEEVGGDRWVKHRTLSIVPGDSCFCLV